MEHSQNCKLYEYALSLSFFIGKVNKDQVLTGNF